MSHPLTGIPDQINTGTWLTGYSLEELRRRIPGTRVILPICSLGTPLSQLAELGPFVLPPLFHEALNPRLKERLLAAADRIPAAMLARVVLERELRKRCHRFNATREGLRGLRALLDNLRLAGRLPRGIKPSFVERLIRTGNKASHGHPVEIQEVQNLITGVAEFCAAANR